MWNLIYIYKLDEKMGCVCGCTDIVQKLGKKKERKWVGYLTLCVHNPTMVLPPTGDNKPPIFFYKRISVPIIFIVEDFN